MAEQNETDNQEAAETPALPEAIAAALGARLVEGAMVDGVAHVTVPAAELLPALRTLAREMENPYAYLSDLCGVDRPDCIEVVYHLFRPLTNDALVVRVRLSRAAPRVASVTELWGTSDWAEREAAEMYGVAFTGHPDPRRLLLPDEIVGHPMRKDWRYPEEHPYLRRDPLHEDFAKVEPAEAPPVTPPPPSREGAGG
jgi:NADH-quinone oxidoreductase subunit C